MTIAEFEVPPIRKSIEVSAPADRAFDFFVRDIGKWWPLDSHSRARDEHGEKTLSCTIEPRQGGRVYETLTSGEEREWGVVLAFESGRRIVLK